jgi:FkbH-like protein
MHFSPADVSRFAAWSRDHNPLHVDPAFARGTFFGQSIVHGMCSVVHALAETAIPAAAARSVDIEFQGAVAQDATYPATRTADAGASVVLVHDPSGHAVLRLRAMGEVADARFGAVVSWLPQVPAGDTVRSSAADRSLEDIAALPPLVGRYRTGEGTAPGLAGTTVAPLHAQVYALCSYLVGMEVPGLRSLFTRAVIAFAEEVDAREELLYRIDVERVDESFRLLDTRVEVAGADGRLLATCVLRSYVRFSPVVTDLSQLRAHVDGLEGLAGRVALVVGGSRGLGADLASALALGGARVFVSYHHDEAGADALRGRLAASGAAVQVLKGDAADPAWCEETVSAIMREAGSLDLLVLNACAAPTPLSIGAASASQSQAYLQQNFALVQAPLAAALPALRQRGGAIAYVSSSYVVEHPPRFGHYVALKQAGEALVTTAVREVPELRGLILRPPPLQTAWNDTPTGAVGTIAADRVAVAFARSVAALEAGRTDTVAEFPPLARRVVGPEAPVVTLAIAASFTADPIEKSIAFWGRELGLAPVVSFAAYNQILQALFDPASTLATNAGGLNVVLLRVQDWLRELPGDRRDDLDFLRGHLASARGDLVEAMRAHRSRARATTLLVLCPGASSVVASQAALLHETEASLVEALAGMPGLHVLRASAFHDRYEVDASAVDDSLRDKIGHIPYSDAYFHVLGTIVLRHAWQKVAAPRKVVVVDCDNTLWRGVVGEVGAEGIEFGPDHLLLQDTLVALSANGVVICLCSKNVEEDVWRVFDTRPDMHLRREHVVAARINWQRKSENIRELAATLNLGLDSFVFLDDNHVECGEVRAGCPEVLTLEWPHDPAEATRLLAHTWELDVQGSTAEDRKRTQMYREELGRQTLRQGTGSFRDFLASLDLVVDVEPLNEADLARASQLTMRTNQFNFTTIRRDESEVRALLESGRHDIRTVRVRDRFGDYGLVGLLIAERADDELRADTFLMSCRVLGRGAEHRMMAEFGRLAQAHGLQSVHLTLDPTKRNAPARAFLETLAPDDQRGTTGPLDFLVPAAALATLEYQPDDADPEPVADDAASAAPDSVTVRADDEVGTRQRRREAQIGRTLTSLASASALALAIDGRTSSGGSAGVPTASREQIETTVLEAFGRSLDLSAQEVRAADGLEALGCTSFRIVEITVHLMQSFPWLPNTLLFEHRAVSAIIDHIATLAEARQRGPERVTVAAPAARPASPSSTSHDVAVVGMDLRCAGARSPEELWALLSAGDVATRPVPPRRRFFSGVLEDVRPHWAGLLDDVDQFDAAFFGISPREADLMDPQLRLFLQVAWGALEDADGVAAGVDPDTGVFAGLMYDDYAHHANALTRASGSPYKSWESFSLANRLSQVLGLRGPSMVVDTACSSSGTALHLACRALVEGDCRMAIVGGVNLILDPDRFAQLGRLGILSSTGRCLAFGKEADGTILGEGVGVVVLRRLGDAVGRGDRIYGVIKGTGVSTGSGTVGFTAPNPQAQAVAIRRAVDVSGVDPRTIGYVETHGTATLLGDPIEVRGLTLGYGVEEGQGPIRASIGSIKPNIGHLEAGAAVMSLIKVLLQLHHRTLLPSVTSVDSNPQIPFGQLPFTVQRELAPWTTTGSGPRRAAMSSFGVGGANVHVILEEAPEPGAQVDAEAALVPRSSELVTLSARSEASLRASASQLDEWLRDHAEASLTDVAFTLNATRRSFEHRVAMVAPDTAALRASLGRIAQGEQDAALSRGIVAADPKAPKVAFLFTGQGAQFHGMGRALYASQPVFREAIDACATHLDPLLGVGLVELLHGAEPEDDRGRLDRTRFTQPALFAIEYALARLWQSWGVQPAAVVGHSVGEFAAMCIAGGLSLADAARLIDARGRLMQALPPGGVMLSVAAPEARVREVIAGFEDRVSVAGVNSPQQTVISGAREAIDEIGVVLTAAGVRTRPLTVSHAFHSPLMRPMVAAFEAEVKAVTFREPLLPIIGCADGVFAPAAMQTPQYWTRQVLEPVRFLQAMETLREAGIGAYIEIGPQPVLTGLGRQCLGAAAAEAAWLPSIKRDADEWQTMLASAGQLHVAGVPLDWAGVGAPAPGRLVSLPRYAFDARRHWVAAPADAAAPSVARVRPSDVGVYGLSWTAVAPPADAVAAQSTWLVMAARNAISDVVVQALTAAGDRCVVIGGDAAIDDAELRRRLGEAGTVRGVVHLRGIDAPGAGGASVDALDTWRSHALDSVLATVQAVVAHGGGTRVFVVTQGAVAVGDGMTLSLPQATLWGFGRTVALEHPEAWGGLIDLPATAVGDSDVAAAVAVLRGDGDEDQIAVRGGAPLAARLVRRAEPRAARFAVGAAATYLITGGMGALGLQVARWLTDRGARRLVLVGRQVRDGDAVADLRRLGVHVDLEAADIASPADVDALLARVCAGAAPLRGIIHAAGVDAPRPIVDVTPADLDAALSAKMAGAWLLHDRTRDLALEFFVCFSSLASVFGATGRAPYAAANAFLDVLAAERRRQGLTALTVNWGPWAGAGMAAEGSTGSHFAAIGNHLIDPADALPCLEALIASDATDAVVADIEWPRFSAAYQSRRTRPLIALVAADGGSAGAGLVGTTGGGGSSAHTLSAEDVARQVREEVGQVLGYRNVDEVPLDRGFFEMGLDSLSSVELATRLEARFGVPCRGFVFDTPTVGMLGERLARDVAARAPGAGGVAEHVEGSAVATAVSVATPRGSTDAASSPIVLYTPALEEAMFAFHEEAFGTRRRADWVRPRWRWMFEASARRLHRDPQVWVYRDGDRVVGHNGALPVEFKLGHVTRQTAWLVETNVLDAYRALAVGPRMLAVAQEALPFALSLGQTETMRTILLKMGWRSVAPLQTSQFLLRPERVLKGKLPPGAALGAGIGLRALASLKRLGQSSRALAVQPIDRYGPEHDTLWTAMATGLGCAVVRNASYLNWKYVEQPGQSFLRYDMRNGDRLVATSVWMVREPDEAYRYRRAFLVDLVTPLDEDATLDAVVRTGCGRMAELGADAVICLHTNERLTRALSRCGFSLREPGRFLLVYPEGLTEAEATLVLEPTQWLVTQGDSDIDRPW